MLKLLRTSLPGVLCLFYSTVFAAPPNDNCSNATTLTVSSSCNATNGTTFEATQSMSGCSGDADDDVWYKFVATQSNLTITVQGLDDFDAVVELLSGCAGTSLQCTDLSYSGETELLYASGLTIGNTYYVRVYDYYLANATGTSFSICITPSSAPVNDNCANATSLTVSNSCTSIMGTTAYATQSIPGCNGSAEDDVWYKFVAAAPVATITVYGSYDFDAVIQLLDGCAGASIQCVNDNSSGIPEEINATGLTVGNTYFIRVYDYTASMSSTPAFHICVNSPIPPANDNCANATSLTVSNSCTPTLGMTENATQSMAGCFGTAEDDVWYKFTAVNASATITVTGSSDFDAVIQLLDGCSGTSLDCMDDGGNGGSEIISASGLTIGNTYYVRIYDYGSSASIDPTFSVCVTSPIPPANDDCANATTLTIGDFSVNGSIAYATQSMAACTGTSEDDIWYKFVATSSAATIYVEDSYDFNSVVQLLDGCSGTSLDCVNDFSTGSGEILYATGLTVGNTYYIRVYDYDATVPASTTFSIFVVEPPANDECVNATELTVAYYCNSPTSGNTAHATQSMSACYGYADDDVWYKFVAINPTASIYVDASNDFDAVVQFLDGGCNGTSIECLDNSGTGSSETTTLSGLTVGNTYYLRVYDAGYLPATTTFTICVTSPLPPSNDDCEDAISLTVAPTCSTATAGTTENATPSTAAACMNTSAEDDVWYKFVANNTTAIITVVGSSYFDAVVQLLNGCNGASIMCVDSYMNGGTEVLTATGLTIGNTYYVRVYDYYSLVPASTTFTICVTSPLTNDACNNAIPLPVVTDKNTMVPVSTVGATQSLAGCAGNANDDVWYKFVANNSRDSIYVTTPYGYDAVVEVFSGCSGASVVCQNQTGSFGDENIYLSGLIPGQTYYLRVYDFSSGIGIFDLSIYNGGAVINGLEETFTTSKLSLYPNPAKTELTLNLSSFDSEVLLEIIDAKGNKVIQKALRAGNESTVNVENLENGVYMAKISSGNHFSTERFVILK